MTFIPYRVRGDLRRVFLENIIYIKSAGRKIIVDTVDGVIEFYGYMREIIPLLDSRFCKSHGSLVVNLTMINHFENNEVMFKNGDSIHIGNHNLSRTKKIYMNYLEKIARDILN